MRIFLDGDGQPINEREYYTGLVRIAQERQRAFPWWSAARRRWRAHERRYRILAGR